MPRTMWFDQRAGESVAVGSEKHGDPTTILVSAPESFPDWVRLPPKLGGRQLKVLGAFSQECPKCKGGAPVKHLELAEGYIVAECRIHGFMWYRPRRR